MMTGPNPRAIAERLNGKFKVVCSCDPAATVLQLSGPLETQDELDALVEALAVMRDWLPEKAAESEQTEDAGA